MISTNLNTIKDQMQEYFEKTDDHENLLHGKDNQVGVVAQVAWNTVGLAELVSALKGEKDKPGLISVISGLVDKLNKRDDTDKWLYRLMAGAVILAAISWGMEQIFGK